MEAKQHGLSSPMFMCGVAKPQRRIRTCPLQDKIHSERFLQRFHAEPSISHHKRSLNINSRLPERPVACASQSINMCTSRVPRLTLRDVINTKSACVCGDERFIGIRDQSDTKESVESLEVSIRNFSCIYCARCVLCNEQEQERLFQINFPYILLNETRMMFLQLAKQSSRQ